MQHLQFVFTVYTPGGALDSLPGQRSEWLSVIGCKYQAKMATIRGILAGFFSLFKANLWSATCSFGVESIMNIFSPCL